MKKELFEINSQGELTNPALLDDIREAYRPDSPFLGGIVPYIIMAVCGFIDGCFFYSLFSLISYDRPLLLWVQIAGFIFGFDCIPIFAGIHYKRLKQGLTKDTFTFRLALAVCALICTANIGLRAVTVDVMSPDLSGSGQSYFQQASEPTVETEETPDLTAWMLAVMGMVVPVVTSVGSFYISNHCYDPLQIKKRQEEKRICRKADRIRRLNTMICAYKENLSIEQRLLEDDAKQCDLAKGRTIGQLLEGLDYIGQRLMERQQDPAATSVLSMTADREAFVKDLMGLCDQVNSRTALPVPTLGTMD